MMCVEIDTIRTLKKFCKKFRKENHVSMYVSSPELILQMMVLHIDSKTVSFDHLGLKDRLTTEFRSCRWEPVNDETP